MKVRLIDGIREVDHKDPLYGLWLAPVAFPMRVTNYDATSPTDPEKLTLCNEEQLEAWAEGAFEEAGYDIFELEAPSEDAAEPGGGSHQYVLRLISAKKAEYEQAAATSRQSRGEIEAVIAALDSLLTHARAITAETAAPDS